MLGRRMSIAVGSEPSILPWRDARGAVRPLAVVVVACLALAVWVRVRSGFGAELWFDEGGTGAFAVQPSLLDVTRLAYSDPNAPVYAYLMWFWVHLFGASNAALHGPSFIVSVAAPVLAWTSLRRSRPAMALVWAASLAVWLPGIALAGYARCYALLFLAAVAATAAHRRALQDASLRSATAWTASAAFMTLVHYHAGFLALTQGLVLVATHRRRCLALWPALLAFAPAVGWIAWHAPRLVAYAKPDHAWYHLLTASDLPDILQFLCGMPGFSLLAAAGVGFLATRRAMAGARSPLALDRTDLLVGAAAVAGALICVGLGFLRPTFALRYLTPFAPGVLALSASLLVAVAGARPASLALSVGALAAPLAVVALSPATPDRSIFGTEAASAWLAQARPETLAFFWDNPATDIIDLPQLDIMGGFFLRRAGLPVRVVPIQRAGRDDLNGAVFAAGGPSAAILWVYDTAVQRTTATTNPPHGADAGRECRDFGTGNVGIFACRPAIGIPMGARADLGGP